MRNERIKLSKKVEEEIQIFCDREIIYVPYDIRMVLYKHVGSMGGVEAIEPIYLREGLHFGNYNWTMYNFMYNWLETIRAETLSDKFELLFNKSSESEIELERFVEENGGKVTLEELREFRARKNIRKWKSKNADPPVIYIGKGGQ